MPNICLCPTESMQTASRIQMDLASNDKWTIIWALSNYWKSGKEVNINLLILTFFWRKRILS